MMSTEPDYLWNKIIKGDEKAFMVLFREMYPFLRNFVNKLIGNSLEAEEVVQDTFVNIWLSRDKISIQSSIKPYLYQTAHNLAINRIEKLQRNKNLPNQVASTDQWKQIHDLFTIDNDFVAAFEAKETEESILQAINKLPDNCREIFILSRYNDLSYEEIANRLGLSNSTIRVQIFRALEFLRDYLKKKNIKI